MQTDLDPARLLRTFLDINLQLSQELDVRRVLTVIVERSMELTEARYGAAVTLSPDGQIEDFIHRGLTEEQVALLPHLPEGKGLLGLVLKERRPIRLDRLQDHPASVGFPDAHVPMHAFLGVPLQRRGDLVGALYLTKRPKDPPFTFQDEEFFTAVASAATVAITNARLYAGESERAERSALMSKISAKVRGSLDVDNVIGATVEALGIAAGVDRCFVQLVGPDEESPLARIEYEWMAPDVRPLMGTQGLTLPITNLAQQTLTTQWSDDISTDPRLPETAKVLLSHGAMASLATPLEWGGELHGLVSFHSATPRKWTESDIALIEAAAREVSIALHHARLYDSAIKTAGRLQELDELRSDFISMVSHELRSPMTVVAGISDILHRNYTRLRSDERDELVKTLGREARRLVRLVSEVLDLEAIDQGAFNIDVYDSDLAEVAREAVADSGTAESISLQIDEGETALRIDADRIKQVVLNLISNAAKFSEGAPIDVVVTPDQESVTVSVADRGPGVAEELRDKLFTRFSRLPNTEHRPGSGLGLYLSRMIVERHGGKIWVDSTPGEGATFAFRIPR